MIVAIYASSISKAIEFINADGLHNCFMQLVEDQEMKHSYWIIFKMNKNLLDNLIKANPRLTVRV